MSDANTSAPAETGELDMSAAADLVPDDAFELAEDSPEEHPEGGTEPGANEEAPVEGEPEGDPPAEPTTEGVPPAEPEQPEPTAEGPQTVVIDGKARGVIVRKRSYDQYVHVKFDGSKFDVPVHPLDLDYRPAAATPDSEGATE